MLAGGSLYDAVYGNDVIAEDPGVEKAGAYNPVRGQKVIDYGRDFLGRICTPGQRLPSRCRVLYRVEAQQLLACMHGGASINLAMPEQFIGFLGAEDNPTSILLQNNRLHLEIQVDSTHQVGATDKAGVKDIVLEAALTTIMDCEDSVAAVDAEDKALAYSNWLGLNKGTLEETITRGDKSFVRSMNPDREYLTSGRLEIDA